MPPPTWTRRKLLARASQGAASVVAGAPTVLRAQNRRPKIRVVGTHVTLREPIRRRAERDLGIDIEFMPGGSAQVLFRASTEPDAFDLYEQWSNSIRVLWQAGTIQPIETSRIDHWDEINSLAKTGRISPDAKTGAGDAPHRLLYVQPDRRLDAAPTSQVSFLPYVHNVDSYGYDARYVERGVPYETESWGWLFDDAHHGRVAIVNAPTIGLFDLALAARARGLMDFVDLGNPTRGELDELFRIVVDYKRRGHFRGVWTSVPESVEFMASEQVRVQSMFSPGVTTLNGRGIPCVYAAPREGYRAWYGVMCMSKRCTGERRDAAYAFMNWWLSGWPGAFIARQGYYISNPERSRPLMSDAEWAYWYGGQPASEDLHGPDGDVVVAKGEVRTGGSYQKRFEHVAVWNSVIDHYEYSLLKWNEFVSA